MFRQYLFNFYSKLQASILGLPSTKLQEQLRDKDIVSENEKLGLHYQEKCVTVSEVVNKAAKNYSRNDSENSSTHASIYM